MSLSNISLYLRRRFSLERLEDAFKFGLDYVSKGLRENKRKWNAMNLKKFIDVTLTVVIDHLHMELTYGGSEDFPHFPYDDIYDSLHKTYSDRITERYYEIMGDNENTIKESNKELRFKRIEVFQRMIDNAIDNLRIKCETMNTEYDEYVNYEACELISANLQVKLSDVKQYDDRPVLLIVIKYKSSFFIDEDNFIYELSKEIQKYTGVVSIEIEDMINTYKKNAQW